MVPRLGAVCCATTRSIARRLIYKRIDDRRNTPELCYKLDGALRALGGSPQCLELHSRRLAQATSPCATRPDVLVPATTRSAASGGALGVWATTLKSLGEHWQMRLKGLRRLAECSATSRGRLRSKIAFTYAENFDNWAIRELTAEGVFSGVTDGPHGGENFGFPPVSK